ncbi:MAG: hypothetical protein JWN72_1309 [Thermoleophilia bacterium]|nr:hypothetical protein [Thermoleophilia bacterium]
MSNVEAISPEVVRRAARIAHGPHTCPWCSGPTRTDPPLPWRGLRDYLVPCEACDRPILVKIRRERIARKRVTVRLGEPALHGVHEHVGELLAAPGGSGLLRRVAAALPWVVLFGLLVGGLGGGRILVALAMLAAVVPAAMWGPVITGTLVGTADRLTSPLQRRSRAQPVQLAKGRFDQWAREEQHRSVELREDPDAVFAELALVLDHRELRRVRELTAQGEVPLAHLDDLLRRRRGWTREDGERIGAAG